MARSTTFEIESYKVTITQTLDSNPRKITLESKAQTHGIRFNVTVLFLSANPYKNQGTIGQVSNFGAPNFDPVNLAIWMDLQSFDGFYHVLSTEKPAYFTFTDSNEGTTSDVLSAILSTDKEFPGDFEKQLLRQTPAKL